MNIQSIRRTRMVAVRTVRVRIRAVEVIVVMSQGDAENLMV
jgi:hypothetical protein